MIVPGTVLKPNDALDYADRAIGLVRLTALGHCKCDVCEAGRLIFTDCEPDQ
jgi:hypothetical protein